jgi:hypothetical protein
MSHWKNHWTTTAYRHGSKADFEQRSSMRTQDMNRITSRIDDPSTPQATPEPPKPHQKPDRKLLTTPEAAEFLRLSPRTLERFRVEGTGPRYTKAGPGKRARVLYRRDDLEAWLDGFEYGSTAEYGD